MWTICSSILRYSNSCYCFSCQLIRQQQWLGRKRSERENERGLFTSVSLKWCWLRTPHWHLLKTPTPLIHHRRDDNASIVMLNPASPLLMSGPLQFSDKHFIRRVFSSAGVFRSSFVFRGVPTNAKSDKFYKTNRSLCGGICFRWKMWGFYCSWVFATTPSVNYVLRVWRFGNLIFVKNWYWVLTLVDYIYINQNHRQKVILSATLN